MLDFEYNIEKLKKQKVLDRTEELRHELITTWEFVREWNHEIGRDVDGLQGIMQLLEESNDQLSPGQSAALHKGISYLIAELVQKTGNIRRLTQSGRIAVDDIAREEIDLQHLFEEILAIYSIGLKDIQVDLQLSPDMPPFIIEDRYKLQQIIQNLLTNAVKFSPRGKTVRIYLSCRYPYWTLQISDEGEGIAAENLERIFQPFSRLNKKVPGTGIGLSITRKLVGRLQGKISVDSIPGAGSTFTVLLPLHERNVDTRLL